MKLIQLLVLCWGVLFQIESYAAEPLANQIESIEQETSALLQSTGQAQADNTQQSSLFGIPHSAGSVYRLTRQRELLEASAQLAALLREIKSNGNEEAVLGLLKSMNEHESVVQFTAAFAGINLDQTSPPHLARENRALAPAEAAANPIARRPLVPVLAQTAGEDGSQERVVVMVGARRYSRSPGESIEFDGRVVLIDAIENEVLNGNEVTTIWVTEDGKREALQWLP